MPSLKEIKTRIASVESTRKITSAMKMVASSKLHHAQVAIQNMLPYENLLEHILKSFLISTPDAENSLSIARNRVKRVALVVYSSNSSLCGGFNNNVIRMMLQTIEEYKAQGVENIVVYPIGRKVSEKVSKLGFTSGGDFSELAEKPDAEKCRDIADELTSKQEKHEFDKVELIYHHFKSAGSQILTEEQFLPIEFPLGEVEDQNLNFLVEPHPQHLLEKLIPQSLHLKLYSAMLDSLASEHAARVIAMQVATDNADELLRQLTLQYNKSRQQAITAELLDIVGGSLQ